MSYTIRRDNQNFGPYTRDQIKIYLSSGSLLPTDLVRGEEDPHWLSPNDLFRAMAPPPLPVRTPSFAVAAQPAPPRFVSATASASVNSATATAAGPAVNRIAVGTTVNRIAFGATVNRIALGALGAIWITWFFLPLLNVGMGPLRVGAATLWDCLGLLSSGALRFFGLAALALPFLAIRLGAGALRILYLAPLVFHIAFYFMVQQALSDASAKVGAVAKDTPIFGDILQSGFRTVLQSASLDYGGYILGAAILLLASQIFADQD